MKVIDNFISNFEAFNNKLIELKIENKEELLKEFIKNYIQIVGSNDFF